MTTPKQTQSTYKPTTSKLYDQVYDTDRHARMEAADKRYMAKKRKQISASKDSNARVIELVNERDALKRQRDELIQALHKIEGWAVAVEMPSSVRNKTRSTKSKSFLVLLIKETARAAIAAYGKDGE